MIKSPGRRRCHDSSRTSTSRGSERSGRMSSCRWKRVRGWPRRRTPSEGAEDETRGHARKNPVSEYQYYEFLTVDRPLTTKEMAELRSFSTRARITPTTFVNEYSWGNFKGDEEAWMERYFDAFLYVANWST